MKKRLAYVLVFFLPFTAYPQNIEEGEKIAPDRPGFGDAVSVVPKFGMHIETGTWYEQEKFLPYFTQEALGLSSTLLRYGLFKRTELRFDYNLFKIRQTNTNIDQLGLYPCRLGMKYHLVYNKGLIPAITFIGMHELEFTATKNFRSPYPNTDLQLSFANQVSHSFAICYNLGSAFDFSGNNSLYYYALALEFHLSDKLGYYLQGHGWLRAFSGTRYSRQNCETGLMFYPNHNMQIDLSAGLKAYERVLGSTISVRDHSWFFISAGFSWRFSLKKRPGLQTSPDQQ